MNTDLSGGDGPALAPGGRGTAPARHIVDVLLEERAPHLLNSPLWPLLGPLRDTFFGYRKARAMADAIGPMAGGEAMAYVSRLLHLEVTTRLLEARLPADGPCIIASNHPTGIADGIAVYDAVKHRRPEVRFFANADALRICPGFDDVLIPVPWPASKRTMQATRLTLAMARTALREGRLVVIFPAGVMSRRIEGVIQDPPWEHSAIALARRYHAPIVPVHVAGPHSFLFHLFGRFSQELRNITLFHELVNKVGGRYCVTFGQAVDPVAIEVTSESLTQRLKHYVERTLPATPEAPFA